MKSTLLLSSLLAGCLCAGTFFNAPAAETTPPAATPAPAEANPAGASQVKKLPPLKYKAPPLKDGKLGERISGGTRGANESLPRLDVLAPNHVALTSSAQPTLFWYQSAPAKVAFELTLTEQDEAKPLVKLTIEAAEAAGIRALSLARQNVKLKPGVVYRWSVALIPDMSNRSKDLIASAAIKLAPLPPARSKEIEAAAPAERTSLYAEAGYWYDALQSAAVAIAAAPADFTLHERRAALLKQAGLEAAAAAALKR
jgi:hypothetical protein